MAPLVEAPLGVVLEPAMRRCHDRTGNRDACGRDATGVWHSQSFQDEAVTAVLMANRSPRRGGFFVDLAANEPFMNSNTRALERDLAWRGICVDAAAGLLEQLRRLRSCTVVDAIVSNATGDEVSFREFVTDGTDPEFSWVNGLSGIIASGRMASDAKNLNNAADKTCWGRGGRLLSRKRHCLPDVALDPRRYGKRWRKAHGVNLTQRMRTTTSLADLLHMNGSPRVIDYLSLDVEGSEDRILSTFPFDSFTFLVLTVEQPHRRTSARLVAHGYTQLARLGAWDASGDQLWVHRRIPGGVAAAKARLRTSGVPLFMEKAPAPACGQYTCADSVASRAEAATGAVRQALLMTRRSRLESREEHSLN